MFIWLWIIEKKVYFDFSLSLKPLGFCAHNRKYWSVPLYPFSFHCFGHTLNQITIMHPTLLDLMDLITHPSVSKLNRKLHRLKVEPKAMAWRRLFCCYAVIPGWKACLYLFPNTRALWFWTWTCSTLHQFNKGFSNIGLIWEERLFTPWFYTWAYMRNMYWLAGWKACSLAAFFVCRHCYPCCCSNIPVFCFCPGAQPHLTGELKDWLNVFTVQLLH